jgi:uncharacterized protein YbjT (DUF2867 family)
MVLALFGGTGRIGGAVRLRALERGLVVRALVRNPARLESLDPRVVVVRGAAADAAKVHEVIDGADAVITALGGKLLWAGHDIRIGTRHIVDAMHKVGCRRLIAVSAMGIGDSRSQMPAIFQGIFHLLRSYVEEKEGMEQIVRESRLDWVIARPAVVVNKKATGGYRAGVDPKIRFRAVTRVDLADFLLDQLEGSEFLGQAPVVVG